MADFAINFPDLGKITLDLNKLAPSMVRALRDTMVEHEEFCDGTEVSQAIEALEAALNQLDGQA